MKLEQEDLALSLRKGGKESEYLKSVETDDFAELKKRGLNLRPIARLIQRNVLLVTGITATVAVATLSSALTSKHNYEGEFRLLVEPITSEAKYTDPSVLSRNGETSNATVGVDYPSLIQVLESPGLLDKIVKRIHARYPDVSYDSLSKNLVVQRVGKDMLDSTKIIEVSYKGENPEKVQFILAEVAKGYLNYSLEERKTRIGEGVKFIDEQLPRWQEQVNNLAGNLQMLQQRYKLSDPVSQVAELSKQVHEIQAQRLDSQRELQEQRRLYTNLQSQLGLRPNEAITASTLSQEPHYQDLLSQLKKTESQIAVESARFSEESPVIQKLREQQKNLSRLLNQEAQKILGQNIPSTASSPQLLNFQNSTRLELIKQLVDTANRVQVLEARNQAVTKAEAFLDQQVRQFPASMRTYNDLQRRLEIATKTLNQLLIQRETLRVDAAQKEVPWEIVSEPKIPRDAKGNPIPASTGNPKKLAMGVIAALMLGLGAAVIKEKYCDVFYTIEEMEDALKLPLLGVIPLNKGAKKIPNSSAIVKSIEGTQANHSDASLFLEAFDSLYASIHFLASNPPVRSLVVSSAASGDGKTTTALHLAQAAALMGQRVLLVDANLRQPQLHTSLGLPNVQGLSNLLSQNLDPNPVLQRSPLEENLFVLTSGQIRAQSTRLLASNRMQDLMEQFQTAFDLVIYDAPHLLGLTDAKFLAEHTDGVLMVVGVGNTKRSVVMQVINGLNTFRLPILGIVANHVKTIANSSYDYNKRHYEHNHRVRPTFEKIPKVFTTDLLNSVKATDEVLR